MVRGWLARALTAPRGPQWVCENCHNIHADWTPVCNNCGAFDTLSWKAPPHSEIAMPAGAEMLPLLVGGGADRSEPDSQPVDAEVLEPDTSHEPGQREAK